MPLWVETLTLLISSPNWKTIVFVDVKLIQNTNAKYQFEMLSFIQDDAEVYFTHVLLADPYSI